MTLVPASSPDFALEPQALHFEVWDFRLHLSEILAPPQPGPTPPSGLLVKGGHCSGQGLVCPWPLSHTPCAITHKPTALSFLPSVASSGPAPALPLIWGPCNQLILPVRPQNSEQQPEQPRETIPSLLKKSESCQWSARPVGTWTHSPPARWAPATLAVLVLRLTLSLGRSPLPMPNSSVTLSPSFQHYSSPFPRSIPHGTFHSQMYCVTVY